jgi:hypothetical protein
MKAEADNIKIPRDLAKKVAAFFKKHPYASWDSAIAAIARRQAKQRGAAS